MLQPLEIFNLSEVMFCLFERGVRAKFPSRSFAHHHVFAFTFFDHEIFEDSAILPYKKSFLSELPARIFIGLAVGTSCLNIQ